MKFCPNCSSTKIKHYQAFERLEVKKQDKLGNWINDWKESEDEEKAEQYYKCEKCETEYSSMKQLEDIINKKKAK